MSAMNPIHGETSQNGQRHKTPEYISWIQMRQRCLNQNHHAYARYGGRGITICPEWSEYAVFLADMGRRPILRASLDRRDNDGNYEPGNCRWATAKEQSANKTHSSPRKPRVVLCDCGDCKICKAREATRRWQARRKTGESAPQRPLRCECGTCRMCKDRVRQKIKRQHGPS